MSKKTPKPFDLRGAIREAVEAGIKAGRSVASLTAQEAYKATERRLYAYPVLVRKIAEDKERLEEYQELGIPERSRSITRFSGSGMRLKQEEILDGLMDDTKATIAANEYEVLAVERALQEIEQDAYCDAVKGRYIRGLDDDAIAEAIQCDASTVRRNRGRLVRRMALWLYGVVAM